MDKTVHVSVEIWAKLRLTASKLRELWEEDLEHNEDLQKKSFRT